MNSLKAKEKIYLFFSLAGTLAALNTGLGLAAESLSGGEPDRYALIPAALMITGAACIFMGKRLPSVLVAVYVLARSSAADLAAFIPYTFGIAGAFLRDRAFRIASKAADTSLLDPGIAVSFIRAAGGAGLTFGCLVAMFAMAGLGGFTLFNLADAFLIILFAVYTLKGRFWAGAAQLILSLSSMTFAHAGSDAGLNRLFGFVPLMLLQLYMLGLAGVIATKRSPPAGGRPPVRIKSAGRTSNQTRREQV